MRQIQRAVLVALLLRVSGAAAQVTTIQDEAETQPPTYKMTVSPAAEPAPALKFRFLVPPVDQIDANAATFYYKAMVFEGPDQWRWSNEDKIDDWQRMPLEKLPRDEIVKEVLHLSDETGWQPLAEAARCKRCDWGDPIRAEGAFTMLPQAQKMRAVCRGIALKARLEIASGKYADAVDTLRLGYAFSRNMGRGGCCLVQSLIGIAIGSNLDDQTRTLMAAENSPNLYWALSALAADPVDLRQALSYETQLWEFTVHELADLDRRQFTETEARDLAVKAWKMKRAMWNSRHQTSLSMAELLLWCVKLLPDAQKYLSQNGYQPAELKAMPLLQVVLLYRWKQYQALRDDYFKWANVPGDEAHPAMELSHEKTNRFIHEGVGEPFSSSLPAISASINAQLRSIRGTNLLRIVEALRMFAAEHGRWPDSLDEVKIVPVPRDPYTKQPFEYSLKGGVATLATAHDKTWNLGSGAAAYELTLRQTPNK